MRGPSGLGPEAGLTPAIWAELQNKQKKTSAQRKEDEGAVYTEGMLDQAPDGRTDYASRHTEPEGPKLLPDDYSHANEDSKPLGRSERRPAPSNPRGFLCQ